MATNTPIVQIGAAAGDDWEILDIHQPRTMTPGSVTVRSRIISTVEVTVTVLTPHRFNALLEVLKGLPDLRPYE